ncbi:hypothetical protein ACSNOK_06455 [Streptomyces sp. URMC 126]|uniref:hypothetical protein n=1 Tax=Streptomyces sp. URMC 126 TaxID=3423401 RepID=UPI003F1C3327
MTRREREIELRRVHERPSEEDSGRLLGRFEVAVDGTPEDYARRLRSVLWSALNIAGESGFEEADELPTETVPDWFAEVSGEHGRRAGRKPGPDDAVAEAGASVYVSEREEERWGLQEWLFTFDPENRSWLWWDVTESADGGTVSLWVDTRGEPVVGCEQLYWLAYTCGAHSVGRMVLERVERWQGERSLANEPIAL